MSKLPKLPDVAFSLLGPVNVVKKSLVDEAGILDFGEFDYYKRQISVSPLSEETEWSTYWHEAAHALWHDTGLEGDLAQAGLEERVCDAFGLYMAAAMKAGFIQVRPAALKKEDPE